MRNKEMTMNDYRAMYAEYCMEGADRSRLGSGPVGLGPWPPESFTEFVAWRKRVEKYFDNNEDSS